MSTPPDSPVEDQVVYEFEPRAPKPVPVALEDLCRQTKFTRQEIRVMYRGFKTVSNGVQSGVSVIGNRHALGVSHPPLGGGGDNGWHVDSC